MPAAAMLLEPAACWFEFMFSAFACTGSPEKFPTGIASTRAAPENISRVTRPHSAARQDVMPFTAEELMLFKVRLACQFTASAWWELSSITLACDAQLSFRKLSADWRPC